MLLRLRNTARRGRSLVPRTFRRIRSRIRPRASTLCLALSMLLACCLSGLPPNDFVRVLDALALVGIGLAEAADLGRNLSDFLLVDAGDGDVTGLGVDGDVDPFRNREADRMRVAELEHDLAPFDLGAIADADDVELALEAFAHALDVVRHERAHQAVERAGLSFFVSPLELHDVVFHVDRDAGDDRRGQASLRSLHDDVVAVLADFDAFRQRDFFLTDARHWTLLTKPGRALRRPRPSSRPHCRRARPSRWRRSPIRGRRETWGSLPCRDRRAFRDGRRARCRG